MLTFESFGSFWARNVDSECGCAPAGQKTHRLDWPPRRGDRWNHGPRRGAVQASAEGPIRCYEKVRSTFRVSDPEEFEGGVHSNNLEIEGPPPAWLAKAEYPSRSHPMGLNCTEVTVYAPDQPVKDVIDGKGIGSDERLSNETADIPLSHQCVKRNWCDLRAFILLTEVHEAIWEGPEGSPQRIRWVDSQVQR